MPLAMLQQLGYACAELDDPYSAMSELCRRPLVYRTLVLSLQNLFKEELQLISAVKKRFPHVEVWLTHIDGRQAALAESMRFGADGLLAEDGLHRMGMGLAAPVVAEPMHANLAAQDSRESDGEMFNDCVAVEAVLTADELRALLQDQPMVPPDDMRSEI